MEEKWKQNVHQKFNESQNRIRLFVINFIVDNQRPYNLDADMPAALAALGISEEEYKADLEVLLAKDGFVIDEERNVNFAYPVSALPTGHHVKLADGREFTAMCAIDAIGAAFTFHEDVTVDSACKITDEPIHIEIHDGKPTNYYPQDLIALTVPLGEMDNWAGSC